MGDVQLVSMDGWEKQIVFKSAHSGHITDLAWSPNGAYLATSGTDGKVHIWQTKDQTIVATYTPQNPELTKDTRCSTSWPWHGIPPPTPSPSQPPKANCTAGKNVSPQTFPPPLAASRGLRRVTIVPTRVTIRLPSPAPRVSSPGAAIRLATTISSTRTMIS
jgi:WD domain, G-beta repeat